MDHSEKYYQSPPKPSYYRNRRFRFISLAALIFFSGLWIITRFGGSSHMKSFVFGRKPTDMDGTAAAAAAAAVQFDGEMPMVVFSPPPQEEQAGMSELEVEIRGIITSHKVVVFSRTYSQQAKILLDTYDIKPKYHVIEVDTREDAQELKEALGVITSQYTFPNVFVSGKSIGGSDDLAAMDRDGSLLKVLKGANVL
ncbi:hypothetical protein BC936DRAFT_138975 [Jimgerdemannia flammicorona]|uniref:Glutaredoxin domain-containing protein n=1 Tax=Jimgerdemannia flammicorona TaxID=994334 RepID=A0A433BBQ1_9FUNG|nr:hypothetical protein BC936DRAFT_138975 [Jimgerdemannia flammicorona]